MRAVVVAGVLLVAQVAHADTVVVMAESSAELDSALRVVMSGRGVDVASAPHPVGALRLERAAAAQRTAAQVGANAAVWIDDADVCAVTADGRDFRHAPLPVDTASPRAFAAIATSLLDEMIRPDAWPAGFDVNVNVAVTPRRDAPGIVAPGIVANPDDVRMHAGRILVEVGPMLSPISVGLQGAVSLSLSPAWRLGVNGAINASWWSGIYGIGLVAVELRHVGLGRSKHWDLGIEAGGGQDHDGEIIYAGFRIARTWELERSALSLAVTPLIYATAHGSVGSSPFPGIYSSLRWQVPL